MKLRLPFRLCPLATAIVAVNLAACAGGSSTQSGYDMAQAQSAQRSGLDPITPVTSNDQRTLACLHCAP